MKVYNLKISEDKHNITISADCKIRPFKVDTVYFKTNKDFVDLENIDYSIFLTSLLIPAMKLNQDIYIDGGVSKKIYKNIDKIQDILNGWNIGLNKIKVNVKSLSDSVNNNNKNGVFFSGGVDSFYTYLKNKAIGVFMDYFILVNGFDISLKNNDLWQKTLSVVNKISSQENVKLISVTSNIRDIIEPIIPWDYSHGGCLASIGILVSKEVSNVYIGSTYSKDQNFPWGSHFELDHLWSSENTNFIHYGSDVIV